MKLALAPILLAAAPIAALLTPVAPTPAFGPPLVCFAFDIAGAQSLPWSEGKDAFEVDPKYGSENLVIDTIKILDESNDIVVHMETLRRAAIYASRFGDKPVKGSHATKSAASLVSDRLLVKLMDRSMRQLAKDNKSTLAWIDAGFALGAATHMGNYHGCDYMAYFEGARAAAPEDAGASFAFIVGFLDSADSSKWEAQFKAAFALAPKGSLLRKNVVAFGEHYLGKEKMGALLTSDKK